MSGQSKSLREMLDEFESIVAWFDQEDLDIDESIAQFEKGSELADQIKKQLQESKNKIELVKAKFESKSE